MQLLTIFPFLQGTNELHIVFILDIVLLCLMLHKINKNKKLTETEKQKLLCLHEGILNIDEVLQLNDFKTIKKMLEEHPICYYEILSQSIGIYF
mgnify:CR=1 FL=1